jgi:hypothetical protein
MRTIRSPLRASVLALALVAVQFGNHALANAEHSPSPPIEASIHTSWTAPPLLLEILYATCRLAPVFLRETRLHKHLQDCYLRLIEQGDRCCREQDCLPAIDAPIDRYSVPRLSVDT